MVKGSPDGSFEISMDKHYGRLLNEGFDAFIMKHVAGKTVPIRTSGGVIYRKATNVGGHRITKRNKLGQIEAGNSPIAWRHPGIKGMHFIERGIADAMPVLKRAQGISMLRKTVRGFQEIAMGDFE